MIPLLPPQVSHIPDAIIMGIDEVGLHFMDGEAETMEVVFTVRYADIRKFAMKSNSIRRVSLVDCHLLFVCTAPRLLRMASIFVVVAHSIGSH